MKFWSHKKPVLFSSLSWRLVRETIKQMLQHHVKLKLSVSAFVKTEFSIYNKKIGFLKHLINDTLSRNHNHFLLQFFWNPQSLLVGLKAKAFIVFCSSNVILCLYKGGTTFQSLCIILKFWSDVFFENDFSLCNVIQLASEG